MGGCLSVQRAAEPKTPRGNSAHNKHAQEYSAAPHLSSVDELPGLTSGTPRPTQARSVANGDVSASNSGRSNGMPSTRYMHCCYIPLLLPIDIQTGSGAWSQVADVSLLHSLQRVRVQQCQCSYTNISLATYGLEQQTQQYVESFILHEGPQLARGLFRLCAPCCRLALRQSSRYQIHTQRIQQVRCT